MQLQPSWFCSQIGPPSLNVVSAVLQTQEKEAKEHMKRMAKELQQQRREGRRMPGLSGIGSNSMGRNDASMHIDSIPHEPPKQSFTAPT